MTHITKDFSFDLKSPTAPALFLPSLSAFYVKQIDAYESRLSDKEYRPPQGFSRDGHELDFLAEDNGLFYFPYALYSAGHANLNIDSDKLEEHMVHKRDKNKTLIVGDSGGYQIGKGILKFDWDNFESDENDKMRMKILRWLEHTADYSMTLDVPVWGIGNERCGLESFDDCLAKTLFNHQFFIDNRVEGATKFLNVLHGRNLEETDIWWEAVKDLPFEGWAFGSIMARDYHAILRRLIVMRDGGYLNDNQSWIHVLGVSKLISACAFSMIQHELRKNVNENITLSFDASSPFLSAAKARMYHRYTCSKNKFGNTVDQAFDTKDLAGSNIPFPYDSAIGNRLTMGDICVKDHSAETKTSWDGYSYSYIMNHNVEMSIRGINEANAISLLPTDQIQTLVPPHLLEFRDICSEVFVSENPMKIINSHRKLLNNLSGSRMDKQKMNIIQAGTNLFKFEDDVPGITEIGEEIDMDIGDLEEFE